MVSPRFLLAAPVEQHLCLDAIPARTSAPPCTLLRGPVRTLQLGAALLGWGLAWVFMDSTHSPYPALHVCTTQGYCLDSTLPCTRSQLGHAHSTGYQGPEPLR